MLQDLLGGWIGLRARWRGYGLPDFASPLLLSGLVGTLISYSLGALPLVLSVIGPLQHVDWAMSALADQQMGGVVMLAVGGAVYLLGGLLLMARVLDRRVPA